MTSGIIHWRSTATPIKIMKVKSNDSKSATFHKSSFGSRNTPSFNVIIASFGFYKHDGVVVGEKVIGENL